MRAAIFHGTHDIRIDEVPDPRIEAPTDAIVRITRTAICGSDLWFYRGQQEYEPGSRTGHEPMGVVEEVGAEVRNVKPGDLVLAPFAISDGTCSLPSRAICGSSRTSSPPWAKNPTAPRWATRSVVCADWRGGSLRRCGRFRRRCSTPAGGSHRTGGRHDHAPRRHQQDHRPHGGAWSGDASCPGRVPGGGRFAGKRDLHGCRLHPKTLGLALCRPAPPYK